MTKHAVLALAGLVTSALVAFAGPASADETASVTTLKTVVVVGNRARPSAAIEVARAKPEIKLKDLNDPKVEKIMRAAAKAPF
jgi:hypothetical protein